jgi:ABC-type sugar transport system substrate-binding protein
MFDVGSDFAVHMTADCPEAAHEQAASVFVGSDSETAETILYDILAKDTRVEAIIAMSDEAAGGAVQAYRKAGRSKADMLVTGFGFTEMGKELLDRSELLATIDEQYSRDLAGLPDSVMALLESVFVARRQPLGLTTITL